MNIAIRIENLSKAYQLGEIGTGTISRDLERWFARMRGKEDPFLRIGETLQKSDLIWSLKDINLEIEQGDAVGIIGRNGAGKSTLLKILSRVTSPTTGKISGKGRIASLLEVGTGFHPELTGRENIYLNGAILGMRKKEIKRKFDEIVDFAGVERYIDTPVKRYSSGMYVRLAFAVAAHLESEILIVDEVLAVGDAEFQKKCLGKMNEVSKGEGRTVLFVSHNMGSVLNLCRTGIVLERGKIKCMGTTADAVNHYLRLLHQNTDINMSFSGSLAHTITFHKIQINNQSNRENIILPTDRIQIETIGFAEKKFNNMVFIISVYYNGTRLFTLRETDNGRPVPRGNFEASFTLESAVLRPGQYTIAVGAWGDEENEWLWGTDLATFTIGETWTENIRKEDEGILNGHILKVQNVSS